MYRGFYTLTSSMMTQQVNLNTISDNMANASTPGYKKHTLATTTFEEVLIDRIGNRDKSSQQELNNIAYIRVPDETVVNYEQGAMDQTGRVFDFALQSDGFFEVETPDGQRLYTRNGSFTLDDEGYLFMQHIGRVMGVISESDEEAEIGPLLLGTDNINVSRDGVITTEDGQRIGRLRVADFADYTQLQKTAEGMFTNPNADNLQEGSGIIAWKMLERSNVTAIDEMVAMIQSQRALQSASQILKMYDQLMDSAANNIGRIY